jgi:hypothetical protein
VAAEAGVEEMTHYVAYVSDHRPTRPESHQTLCGLPMRFDPDPAAPGEQLSTVCAAMLHFGSVECPECRMRIISEVEEFHRSQFPMAYFIRHISE